MTGADGASRAAGLAPGDAVVTAALPGVEAVEIPVACGAGATETIPIVRQIMRRLATVSVVAEEPRICARNLARDRRRGTAMSTDEQPTRARAKRLGLPVAERLRKRFSDAALAAYMSTQRATNEALKAWMASRPAEEQRGVALKASLRALAASEKHKKQQRHARRAEHGNVPEKPSSPVPSARSLRHD